MWWTAKRKGILAFMWKANKPGRALRAALAYQGNAGRQRDIE